MKGQLIERLGALRLEIDPETERMHLERLSVLLKEPPVRPVKTIRVAKLRRLLVSFAATLAVIAAPGGAAIAAEGSMPGDLLYPVKQVSESVRSWFDPSVAANHRLDELERSIEDNAVSDVVSARLRDAKLAVDELDDAVVTDRLSRIREKIFTDQPASIQPRESDPDSSRQPARPLIERRLLIEKTVEDGLILKGKPGSIAHLGDTSSDRTVDADHGYCPRCRVAEHRERNIDDIGRNGGIDIVNAPQRLDVRDGVAPLRERTLKVAVPDASLFSIHRPEQEQLWK